MEEEIPIEPFWWVEPNYSKEREKYVKSPHHKSIFVKDDNTFMGFVKHFYKAFDNKGNPVNDPKEMKSKKWFYFILLHSEILLEADGGDVKYQLIFPQDAGVNPHKERNLSIRSEYPEFRGKFDGTYVQWDGFPILNTEKGFFPPRPPMTQEGPRRFFYMREGMEILEKKRQQQMEEMRKYEQEEVEKMKREEFEKQKQQEEKAMKVIEEWQGRGTKRHIEEEWWKTPESRKKEIANYPVWYVPFIPGKKEFFKPGTIFVTTQKQIDRVDDDMIFYMLDPHLEGREEESRFYPITPTVLKEHIEYDQDGDGTRYAVLTVSVDDADKTAKTFDDPGPIETISVWDEVWSDGKLKLKTSAGKFSPWDGKPVVKIEEVYEEFMKLTGTFRDFGDLTI